MQADFDLLRETFEHLPAGLMLFRAVRNSSGTIVDFEWLFANPAAARLIGRDREQLRGQLMLELLPGNREAGLFDRYVRVVETGQPSTHEFRYSHDDDGWLASRSFKVGDGFSMMFADVSERRRLGRARQDRWELVEGLFMQAPFAISVVHGPDNRYILANPEYERMVGRRNLVGKTLREAFPELPTDAALVQMLDGVRTSGRPFTAREFEVALERGTTVDRHYFQVTCSPVRDENGITAIQSVAVDVTDQVRCRRRAELNERRFKATFETAAVGIAHLSPSGKWLRFNDRVAQLLGYSRAELEQLSFQDVSHPADLGPDVALAESLLNGEIPSYQLRKRYLRKDGAAIWVNMTVSLVRDQAQRPLFFVAVIEDITERKAAEDALREADRQKDEFLAILGHELRNPLAAIRSACALLETIDAPDPLMARIQNILGRQTGHMAHLLDELLDLARVTSNKLTIVPSVIDLRQVIHEVLADLQLADGPRLDPELPDEPVWIVGDRVRLAQVAHNLLSNALKYTPRDGSVRLRLTANDHDAVLTVTDTGVGLDQEFCERLFEPFQQAPQDIARSAGGLGLGLALSKSIVELHQGCIRAYSEGRGRGSTFEVRLPLTVHQVADPPVTPPAEQPRTARVMIVEDNEDAAELLAALLRSRQFEVEVASRGEQALAMMRSWRPDAVICDIGLPDIDGYTVARSIRADPELAGVKLVALSGYGQAKDRVRAAEAGFDQHLTKPAAIDAVIRAIDG
ncbi:MAG TPA: PAS domain S-box protein [Enhygromyxa sp.]|nr:PAS domain S-box protein [Enhygromyxa sp.]